MRHRVSGKKLSRVRDARKALFKNLISSLIKHGQIKTTEAKAKAIRGLVDKLVGRAKLGTLHARRLITVFLQDKKVVNRLVDEIAPKFRSRPSGFTRIIRLGTRRGDQAMIVKMEFVEGEEVEKETATAETQKRQKRKTA